MEISDELENGVTVAILSLKYAEKTSCDNHLGVTIVSLLRSTTSPSASFIPIFTFFINPWFSLLWIILTKSIDSIESRRCFILLSLLASLISN